MKARTAAVLTLLATGVATAKGQVRPVTANDLRGHITSVRTLDPERLRQIVETLAHDSMAGRRTPSAELDKAARYIESHFHSIGALPLGDDGTFFQKYPVTESVLSLDSARMSLGSAGPWRFGRDYFYLHWLAR